MAQVKPDSLARLQKVKGIGPELIDRHSETLLEAIARGHDEQGDSLMDQLNPLSDREQKLYRQLKQHLDQRAQALGINTPVLGTRKDVELLLRGNTGSLLLEGWRRQAVGEELLAMC